MSVWRARASPAFALSESSTSSSRESSTVRLICKRYLSSRPGVSRSRAGEDGTRAVSKVLSPTAAPRAQPLYRAHRDQEPGSGSGAVRPGFEVPYRGRPHTARWLTPNIPAASRASTHSNDMAPLSSSLLLTCVLLFHRATGDGLLVGSRPVYLPRSGPGFPLLSGSGVAADGQRRHTTIPAGAKMVRSV